MAIEKTNEGLKRVVGVPGLALTIVGFTIGSGIFALPAIVGVELGAFAVFGYLFCGIMLAAIMLCYAEIGSRVTSTGGSYAYVEAAFGQFAGFVISWIFFIGWSILADAAIMNIIADSLAIIYPVLLNPWLRGLLFFVLLGFMVLVNIHGAKQGVTMVKIITIIKLVPLFGIIIFGIGKIDTANLQWDHLPTINIFGNTVLILFFAFAGFESALSTSGEIKNPKRTVPLGILVGGILVLIIYLLLQTVTQGILGSQMADFKDAPLAAVAEKLVGSVGGTLLLMAAAISCFGTVSADTLNAPRVLFAGAKNGVFPKFLAKVHPKFATPYRAIIAFAVLIFIISVSGGFKQLAILASAAILLVYLAVILATIKIRKQKQDAAEKTFRAPGGWITPIIGIVAILWLLSSLSKWEILSTIIFIAAICIIYFVMQKLKKEKVDKEIEKEIV
ncbi:MAG: APC family permease [Chitinophagaceae bacterium]